MRINTSTFALVIVAVFAGAVSAHAGAWCYRPCEYEVWELQRMRAEADRGVLHFSYPGKFMRLGTEPSAFYSETPVEGYETIPGAPGVPPHRLTRPLTEMHVKSVGDGIYDLEHIDIGYVCAKADDRPDLFVGESLPEVRNSDTNGFEQSVLMVSDGTPGCWRSDIPLALRYFRFGNCVRSCSFRSQVDWREPVGRFTCGDARKERLWRLGVETLRLCTRTFLVDGVKRDRLPWAADLVVGILAEAYTFGDPEPIKRTLSALGSGDMTQGNVNGIAAFSLWWVIAHDLLQRYFGEADYLRLHYLKIRARMAEIATHEDERGFFVKDLGWDFMDWTDRKGGSLRSEITRQIIYFGALQAAVRLAERMGDGESAAKWTAKSEKLKAAILAAGMDRTRHSRMLAIVFGLVDDDTARRYAAEIAADDLPPTVTPYMSTFEVMALAKAGEEAAALRKFESVWGEMADFGVDAYWEGWDRMDKGNEVYEYYGRPFGKSLCHAWASGPAFLIPGVFLGIRPTADGWAKWEEKPTIPSFAPGAKVVVGTKSGTLRFGGTSVQIQGMSAQPVWPKGREGEMNGFYRFRGEFRADGRSPCVLRSTAAYPYRIRMNGTFAGYGPARAAPGFFRVDEWTLAATNGVNLVEIEVGAGNCGNFHFPHQVPFLQAEVLVGGEVSLATGRNFPAFTTERLRKVPRIAQQRMFSEVYRLPNAEAGREVELAVQPAKRLLPRGYAYPTFGIDDSYRSISRERVAFDGTIRPFDNHIVRSTMPHFGLYPEDELEANPYFDLQKFVTIERTPFANMGPSYRLGDCEAVIFEGSVNRAGFLGLAVECLKPCRLYLTYDEVLDGKGGVDFMRLYGNSSTMLELERPGHYDFEAFVPTAFRYLRALAVGGEAEIAAPYVRSYESPAAYRGSFESSDPALAKIFSAAQRTLAANSVDCITDCPTRERAGWCGDTFFTGKACQLLTGDGNLERLFLSNWLMPDRFDCPADREGLIPAVYPVELKFAPGSFIPNFAMWFILEVEDYARRTGDTDLAKAFRKRLEGVVGFLEKFENSDGLLERLPGWVFVEWSEANNLVQDVNYPSNMQYAMALDAMARMYGRAEWTEKAKRIRAKVREQSWTGKWFCDNAVRQADGTLKPSGKCTETCQYYAFFSGVATREGDAALWKTMVEDFGAGVEAGAKHPEIYPANFIFGRLIRLELLSAAGERARILREMRAHFLPMAERTGTLWEHDRASASCCHGLASIAAVYLVRDVLGVRSIDMKTKTLTMSKDLLIPLSWCQAEIPVSATEMVTVSWRKNERRNDIDMRISDGWKIGLVDDHLCQK